MTFEELSKKVGFEFAFALRYKQGRISESTVDEMTYRQWRKLYESGYMSLVALKNMARRARTFRQWLSLYRYFRLERGCHDEWNAAFTNAKRKAKTLKQLVELCYAAECSRELRAVIHERAKTFDDWKIVANMHLYFHECDAFEYALEKMSDLAERRIELLELYKTAPRGSLMRSKTFEQLSQILEGFNWWIYVYRKYGSDYEFRKLAIPKLRESATEFDHWYEIYTYSGDSDLGRFAYEKMLEADRVSQYQKSG